MPRTNKTAKTAERYRLLYSSVPWFCVHHEHYSEIGAYIEILGTKVVIAETCDAKGIDAKTSAAFIVDAVNENARLRDWAQDVVAALELCLTCNLTWEAEQAADIALTRCRLWR
jgi:hypothetical protein